MKFHDFLIFGFLAPVVWLCQWVFGWDGDGTDADGDD